MRATTASPTTIPASGAIDAERRRSRDDPIAVGATRDEPVARVDTDRKDPGAVPGPLREPRYTGAYGTAVRGRDRPGGPGEAR